MDINIQITGEYIKQSSKTAGAAGSANVNRLLLSFDDSWNGFAKKLILYNAKGENPVEITLTADYLVGFLEGVFSEYAVPIPAEPLEYAGEMQYAIRGYNDATPVQIAKSVTGKLSVLQSVSHVGASIPADPTPTQAEQLQVQIDNLLGDMSELANEATDGAATATTKAGEAAASASAAATSEDNAAASESAAASSEDSAAASASAAAGSASTATTKAGEAAASASAAAGSASAASTSAGSAASSATSAGEAATVALGYMEDAEAAAVTATTKAGEAATSATNAGNSATAASGSASSAASDKTAAEAARVAAQAAQAAAEAARDAAGEIVGGDFLTTTAAAATYLPKSQKGTASGVAELDSGGKVPSSQLPSYVDDVLEYAAQANFPATGETGKIYIALDNNKTFRWSGTAYVEISASLALGETSSTAYRGDRGKTAYDHSQVTGNPHGTTASQVGAIPSTEKGAAGGVASLDSGGKVPNTQLNIDMSTKQSKWQLIVEYNAAGTYTFDPADYGLTEDDEIGAYIIGGGGSGGAAVGSSTGTTLYINASGGGSGYAKKTIFDDFAGKTYPVVVGSGGEGKYLSNIGAQSSGLAGNSSSFNGVVANGGKGGNAISVTTSNTGANGADGGQLSRSGLYSDVINAPKPSVMGEFYIRSGSSYLISPLDTYNNFDEKSYLAAGGSASIAWTSTLPSIAVQTDGYTDNGSKSGNGVAVAKDNSQASATAESGTGYGNGGGAAVALAKVASGSMVCTATSGAGSPGAVMIYKRRKI